MNKKVYCPNCGKIMVNVYDAETSMSHVCIDNKCRYRINNGRINQLDIDEYLRIRDRVEETKEELDKNSVKYFMLTKQLSNKPLLIKNTNSPYEKMRQTLNIVQCGSHDEAVQIFSKKFQSMRIKDEMVVEVNILEA